MATLVGREGVTGRLSSADADLSIIPSGLKRLELEGRDFLETDFLRISGTPGNSAFDVVVSWEDNRAPSISRERDDLLALQDGDDKVLILLPARASGNLRKIGPFETDAAMAVLDPAGRFSLFGVRILRDASGERLWSDVALNVVIGAEGLTVEGLGYGNFLSYRAPETFIGIKRGNGLEVYARTPKNFTIRIQGEIVGAVLNDVPVDPQDEGTWKVSLHSGMESA